MAEYKKVEDTTIIFKRQSMGWHTQEDVREKIEI